jgi:glycosyltransferase involved in cell wall biosynthesis
VHSISSYLEKIVARDFLEDHGVTPMRVIPDAVSLMTSPSAEGGETQLTRLPSEPFLLFIGALRRVKGVEELLAAYQRLDRPPPLVLLGTMEPDSPATFPDGVRVLTDVPHEAVLRACDRCLFGVMPSKWPEPFGTVVCEVMSRGKPVIGTKPGGHTDLIVDGQTGFLVPAGDVSALAEAMQTLIADDARRERFGEAARLRADLFTPEVSLPRIEQFYEELVAGSNRR